ncbi:MAG: aldehyde dehydrogenase family protein, partial [Phreatobacter sp.]|nr:aldehyde dehydrogenase family protein [Phreatobacter sp.]
MSTATTAAPRGIAHTFLNVVDGRSIVALSGATLDVIGPSDGAVLTHMPRSGAEDIDRAVSAARKAFEEGPWGRMTATERGRLLCKLGEAILANHDELSFLESIDTGKPARQGKADITAAARYFEFYGTAADKVHGETIPFLNGYTVAVVRDPHGVTGHIVPWNYPAQIFGRSVAASLACGNTCVVKPAEDACLSLIRICELALEVGFPPGVLNLVTGLGEEAGAALSSHRGIDFISFTGSPEVGTLIQSAAARNHIGCTLELGGKSPQVVFRDADFDAAVPSLVNAIIQNGGQTCSAGSRMLVERAAYDELVERVAERFRTVRVGAWDMDLDCGPMITPGQKKRV